LDPAGRLVASLWRPAPYKQLGHGELVRLEVDGSLDDSFGTGSVCGGQVAIEPDGSILMALGIAFYSLRELCIQELSANGAFVAKANLRDLDGIGVMAVEPNGQVIAGGSRPEGAERSRAVVGLFSAAGLDRGFGQAFLPRLGCRGRNPTEVPQTEPESNVIVPHAYGTPGRDVIAGTAAKDVIQGGPGADLICAGAGADVAVAGPGSDWVFGGAGPDRLFGGPGRDRIFGGPGRDRIGDTDQKRLRN
jgi:Ca2+-binding RTX toxin-like protein